MKKLIVLFLFSIVVLKINAQVPSLLELIDENQPELETVRGRNPEGCFKVKIPLYGNAGATFNPSTGKYKICPGFKCNKCASVTITLGSAIRDVYTIKTLDNVLVYDRKEDSLLRIIDSKEVDFEELQSKIVSGEFGEPQLLND